jgi:membrane protein DedA with SNARE-associated domain
MRVTIPQWLGAAIASYGYWAILVAVALETMGIPFPGETSLLAGAIYAGTGAPLNIVGVIAAAAAGAILGDNVGYTVGYIGGYPLLSRIASLLHIDQALLGYAQRFFERHGDKTVLIGRFFTILRLWVAFLAGANRMPRRVFLVWNAAGGILWATFYGVLGYGLGRNLPLLGDVLHVLGTGGAVIVIAIIVTLFGLWMAQARRARLRSTSHDGPAVSQASYENDTGGAPVAGATPPGEGGLMPSATDDADNVAEGPGPTAEAEGGAPSAPRTQRDSAPRAGEPR